MNKKIRNLIILLIVTFLITCFISTCSKNQQTLMKKDKFVIVLSELMVIERLNIPESEKLALINSLFRKYNTNRELFILTRENYQKDPEFWIEVYEEAKNILRAESDSLIQEQIKSKKENF